MIAPEDRSGRHTANDVFRLFRTIWNSAAAVRDDLPPNPVLALKDSWFKTKKPKTALKKDTLPLWYRGTEKIENPVRRDLLRFILFTGLRRTSACEVRWRDVDLKDRRLRIPAPKGGEERAFDLPLSRYMVELLENRKADNARLAYEGVIPENSEFVFPSWSDSGHVSEPREEIEGVTATIHDLRRTYITVASKIDVNVYKLRLLVNHMVPKSDVTGGYTDLDLDDLREPQQRITDRLLQLVNGEIDDVVVPFPVQHRGR